MFVEETTIFSSFSLLLRLFLDKTFLPIKKLPFLQARIFQVPTRRGAHQLFSYLRECLTNSAQKNWDFAGSGPFGKNFRSLSLHLIQQEVVLHCPWLVLLSFREDLVFLQP